MADHQHTNRLVHETSPYLLQHAHNPVDWHPWGEEAHVRARREDKPILLSIGYSACHWCHVMERESFENDEIARIMNEHFIPIKVDREERPDLDEIYMNAVQIMTGSGGWPLTVFLTPDLKPFYGGTYFPPVDGWGRPGFKTLLTEITRFYRDERHQVGTSAEALTDRLRSMARLPSSGDLLSTDLIRQAVRDLSERFDAAEGGFGSAPKFPPSGAISVLLRQHRSVADQQALHMAELTLQKMAAGGMYDHIGGGFHRYSTDARWLVPHFEKMLYDNALLSRVYLEAFQATGKPEYARVAAETLDYVLREMQGSEGGYFSSQDADSEGEEGKFYVWSLEEIHSLLGDRAEPFCRLYDVTARGNWEGRNILHQVSSPEEIVHELGLPDEDLHGVIRDGRRILLEARNRRVKPGLDDKVLTSWNALMVSSMARGYRVLGDPRFLASARAAARFIEQNLMRDGRLLATYRAGRARFPAYLDDYAFLLGASIELYESDFDTHWLDLAVELAGELDRLFRDPDDGGFFFTGTDHESLLVRTKPATDGSIPSGNAAAATCLLRLAAYTGRPDYASRAQETLRASQSLVQRFPSAFAQWLCALHDYLSPRKEIAVVGPEDAPETREALRHIWRLYAPNVVVAFLDPQWPHRERVEARVPFLQGKVSESRAPRFFVCQNYACQAPTERLDEVEAAVRS